MQVHRFLGVQASNEAPLTAEHNPAHPSIRVKMGCCRRSAPGEDCSLHTTARYRANGPLQILQRRTYSTGAAYSPPGGERCNEKFPATHNSSK